MNKLKKAISITVSLLIVGLVMFGTGQVWGQSIMFIQGGPCVGTEMDFILIGGPSCGTPTVNNPLSWNVFPSPASIQYFDSNKRIKVSWNTAVYATIYVDYSCDAGTAGTAGPLNQTIYSVVAPTVSLSTNNPTLCEGSGSITLTAAPVDGGTNPSYSFFVDGTLVYSGTNNSSLYNTASLSAGSHSTYVVMNSTRPCSIPSNATSSTLNFNVAAKSTFTPTLTSNPLVCSNQTTNKSYYVYSSGTYYNQTFQWFVNGNAQQASPEAAANPFVRDAVQGDVIYCKVFSTGCVVSPVNTSSYTVNITQAVDPTVSINIPKLSFCPEETIVFSAVSPYITGASQYEWKLDGETLPQNSSSISLTASATNQEGYFYNGNQVYLKVTGLTGDCLTSNIAEREMPDDQGNPPIMVKSMPVAGAIGGPSTVCYSGSFTFSVSGNSGPVIWQKCTSGCSTTDDTGWSSNTDGTFNGIPTGGMKVRIKLVDNSCGTKYSPLVTILPQINAGSISQPGVTYCTAQSILLNSVTEASGGNGVLSYQWQRKISSTFIDIPSATQTTFTISPGDIPNNSTYHYQRVVKDGQCETVGLSSSTLAITTDNSFDEGELEDPGLICIGTDPPLITGDAPTGGGGGYTYSWKKKSESQSSWTTIPGVTSASYNPNENITETMHYRRSVTPACPNTSGSSDTHFDVYSTSAGIIDLMDNTSNSVCIGSNGSFSITGNAVGGVASPVTWQQCVSNCSTNTDSGWTTGINGFSNLTTPTSFRAKLNYTSCGTKYSNIILVGIYPQPTAPTIAGNGRFGPGTLTLTASGAQQGASYEWRNPESSIIGTNSEYTTDSISSSRVDFGYARVISVEGCPGSVTWVSTVIEPLPVVTASDNNIVLGAPVSLNTGTYASYAWKNSLNETVGGFQSHSTNEPDVYSVTVTKAGITGTGTSIPFKVYSQFGALNMNYIISNTIQEEGVTNESLLEYLNVNQKSQTIQYFDGLGRPIQTVNTQGSPSPAKQDIIQPTVYDEFGRETVKYLPYTGGTNGWYKTDFKAKEEAGYTSTSSPQYNFYNSAAPAKVSTDSNPYAVTILEASPLNRVLKQGAPGNDWQPKEVNDHSIKKSYEFNKTNDVLLIKYNPATGMVTIAPTTTNRYYEPNELYANKTYDEHDNDVVEYVDKQGRTVCKMVKEKTIQVAGVPVTKYASTYYVYDDLGNLMVVLPPQAIEELTNTF